MAPEYIFAFGFSRESISFLSVTLASEKIISFVFFSVSVDFSFQKAIVPIIKKPVIPAEITKKRKIFKIFFIHHTTNYPHRIICFSFLQILLYLSTPQCVTISSIKLLTISSLSPQINPISLLFSREFFVKFWLHKKKNSLSRTIIFACKYGRSAKYQSYGQYSDETELPSFFAVQRITFFPSL